MYGVDWSFQEGKFLKAARDGNIQVLNDLVSVSTVFQKLHSLIRS